MEEFSCAMVDSCPPYFSEEELTEMFMKNFRRHYDTNRAPLGLYFHTLWFKSAKNRRAFRKFLDRMVKQQDVHIVSNWEVCNSCFFLVVSLHFILKVIQWMQNPTPNSQMGSFQEWNK